MEFQGKTYTYNQMREMREDDSNALAPLTDWFKESKVGEYTRYYSHIVFHCASGFIACYADNINNYWNI